jgi:uncharacterized protein YerC
MHLDITPEVLVSQLALGNTESVLAQTKQAIQNTKQFDKFSKHIISLNDKLKHMNGYIALSNTKPYFKIKSEPTNSKELIEEFSNELKHWSEKYHITLEQVDDKNVYYIIGIV